MRVSIHRLRNTVGALIAILAVATSGPAATKVAEPSLVLAAQWQALGEDPDQAFRIDATSASGLFPPKRDGAIVVPLALLAEARTAGDLRAYLALRRIYRPDAAGRDRDAAATALGYLGLGLGYLGLDGGPNDRARTPGSLADPDRRISNAAYPSSDLDNAPAGRAPARPSPARVAEALGKGGCEADAVALLTRLAGRAGSTVASDARRALHDLGMFAFHPSTPCDRAEDASFAAVKAAL